jgi:lipoate-protein ligase A
MARGRKIVGSAQFRQGGALLQHGSILLEDNQSFVLGLTRGATITESSQRPQELLKRPDGATPLRCREVAEAIARAAGARWSAEWDRAPDFEPALQSAGALSPRYRSAEWTWSR